MATYPTRARVRVEPLNGKVCVHGVEILPIPVRHGQIGIVGFRFRARGISDGRKYDSRRELCADGRLGHGGSFGELRHKPHPSHATLEQAVEWARRIGARQTWFTHIAHDLGHAETNHALPAGMALAYDGLIFPATL